MRLKIKNILISALVFRLLLSPFGNHSDIFSFMDWGKKMVELGSARFYENTVWEFSWPTQPPISNLFFGFSRYLYERVFDFFWSLNVNIKVFPSLFIPLYEDYAYFIFTKLPAILADLGIGYLIWYFFKKQKKEKIGRIVSLVFLFNPAFWYNSTLWGQTESVISFFALLSILLLYSKKYLAFSPLFFFLSIYTKPTYIILAPIYGLVFLKKAKMRQIAVSSFSVITAFLLTTFPFLGGRSFRSFFMDILIPKILQKGPTKLTNNAYNFWGVLAGFTQEIDSVAFLGIEARIWGFIFFGLILISASAFLIKKENLKRFLVTAFLVEIFSYMFLTNMLDRYLYPGLLFATILLGFYPKILKAYIILSVSHLVNLYNDWYFPRLEFLVNLMRAKDWLQMRIFSFLGLASSIVIGRDLIGQKYD